MKDQARIVVPQFAPGKRGCPQILVTRRFAQLTLHDCNRLKIALTPIEHMNFG
jgi:hypothetical protein